MKKEILFLLLDEWSDWEASYLSTGIKMLSEGKYCVKTVGIKEGYAESIGGFKTVLDYNIFNMPKDYEALILIGGMRWRGDKYEGIRSVVNECLEKKKILAAICDAAGFLGTIGVLNNVKHTGNELEDLKKWAGENYCGESNFIPRMAVCDNKIITANGTASLEFAKEVLLTLGDIPKEIIEGWYQFHKLGCYTVDISQLMGK